MRRRGHPPDDGDEDLARGVNRVAREIMRAGGRGAYGDRKVFIASVWAKMRVEANARDRDFHSLDEFKSDLVRLNRRGLVRLHRADLGDEDPSLVKPSETHYLNATFHLVEV